MNKKVIIIVVCILGVISLIIGGIRLYNFAKLSKQVYDDAKNESETMLSHAKSAAEQTEIMRIIDDRIIDFTSKDCITQKNGNDDSEVIICFDFSKIDGYKGIKFESQDEVVEDEKFEYVVTQNGEYKYIILFDDGIDVDWSTHVKTIK